MYAPLPSWWQQAVRGSSQTIVVEAELWRPRFMEPTDPAYATAERLSLEVTGGSVELDVTRSIVRSCNADLVDPTGTITPADTSALLTPYRTELVLRRGFRWGSSTFVVPLGVFVLGNVDIEEGEQGTTIALTGVDRAQRIARNRWRAPYVVPAGTNITTAIATGLTDRWPNMPLDLAATSLVTPQAVFDAGESSDPWRDFQSLAEAAGMVLDVSPAGAARLRVPPDPGSSAPVATYAQDESSTLLTTGRSLTSDDVYNGVVASGESSALNTPVQGEAWDTDPSSPTYHDSDFEVPYFFTSPLLLTNDQCATAAATILQRVLGQSERVEWSNIVDPALDGFDVVCVTSEGAKIDALYAIEALTYPLAATEPMTGRARSRRIG